MIEVERKLHKVLDKDGKYSSTLDALYRVSKYYPDNNLICELDKDKNKVYYTSKDMLNDVYNVGEGLINLGLENYHIAISSFNSYDYLVCEMAISNGVGVVTPIDELATDDVFVTLMNKCEAKAIICSNYVIKKIERLKESLPNLETIICIENNDNYVTISKIKEDGKNFNVFKNKKLEGSEVCKILFTSGTTGANKGVMLTRDNLVANMNNCIDVVKGNPKNELNTSMSVLPMHHATEINTHVMARICCGRLTYISHSMKDLMKDMKIFKPYVITIVPMVANMFYNQIWLNAKKQGLEDKLKKGIKLCNLLKKFGIDITHKIFKDLYAPFGGNLNEIVCGGAMLNPTVVKGLNDIGIHIYNGYGITECGPLVSMNTETIKYNDSVGKICPNLEYKIVDKNDEGVGELAIKGESVSIGYYKDKESTEKVFDNDGYFRSGDLVKEENGYIFLVGRLKNTIILDSGKNIAPEEIEHIVEISTDYLKDCVVYEHQVNGKNMICCGIYTEEEVSKEKIKEDFININKKLPMYKHIGYVNISKTEYEKTALKKVIRVKVNEKHNDEGVLL